MSSNPSVSVLTTMDLPFGRSFRFVEDRLDRMVLVSRGKCGRVCASRDKKNDWEWGKRDVTTLLGHLPCSFFSSYFENIKCEKDFNGNFVKNVIV